MRQMKTASISQPKKKKKKIRHKIFVTRDTQTITFSIFKTIVFLSKIFKFYFKINLSKLIQNCGFFFYLKYWKHVSGKKLFSTSF